MSGEFGGPSEKDMSFKAEGPKVNDMAAEKKQAIKHTLALAEDMRVSSESVVDMLVNKIRENQSDPQMLDALDPNSGRNSKHMSMLAKDRLGKAWAKFEGKTGAGGTK